MGIYTASTPASQNQWLCSSGPIEWATGSREVSPVVQASRARDLGEEYRQPLRWNDIRVPDAHMYPGEYYLEAFRELVAEVTGWTRDHV